MQEMFGRIIQLPYHYSFRNNVRKFPEKNFSVGFAADLKATSGSSDAHCWSRGTCWQPALCGRPLGEGDEQLLQQAPHHPHHL